MSITLKETILIVDDKPENISVLFDFLTEYGFEILIAEDGYDALEIAAKGQPMLILLDVMMPGIDGFETCQRLKQNPITQEIPVVFMTALAATVSKVQGFKVGGVDYITKPFQQEEVLARIKTHLTIRYLQKTLQQKNEELEQQNISLVTLNEEKNEFLGIAAHDLKNPLSAIQGLSGVIKDSHKISPDKVNQYATYIHNASAQMFDLINNLLDINKIETGNAVPVLETIDLKKVLVSSVAHFQEKIEAKKLHINFVTPNYPCYVKSDKTMSKQIIDNLLSNAIKYSPKGKNIFIKFKKEDNKLCLMIKDEGEGISKEDQAKLFGKFMRLKPRPTGGEHSTGLGLFIVKRLVDTLQGKVWCETEEGNGSTFHVCLISAH